MLVLARKVNEKIRIGEGDKAVFITIVRLDSKTVRIGIEADRSIPVVRCELDERAAHANPASIDLEQEV